jgi:Spy/CpxP family protein refolding chaperone
VGVVTGGILGVLLTTSASVYSFWGFRHHRGGHSAEEVSERVSFMTEWVLKKVDASEEQTHQVQDIVLETVSDLFPLKDQHRANRQAFRETLAQPTIDRQALENIRTAELQLAETMSSRIVGAIADTADVLTPEQRTELAEMAARFHGKHDQ